MSTYMVDGKKMMNICILEILRKYTDSEHTMDQKDIIKKLETEYGMKVDRKSVKSNLMNLVDFGYNLECTEIERENKNGEIEILTKDWYYNHEFDDAELRMLIDSILFSKGFRMCISVRRYSMCAICRGYHIPITVRPC